MIITVTMNPAIDKTVEIDEMKRGGLNRIIKSEYDVGGKGINVSKTIRELGGKSIATGFAAGSTGETIRRYLEENEIKTDFIEVGGETRTNTKVYEKTGELTELNELGPIITEEQTKLLWKSCRNMRRQTYCSFWQEAYRAEWIKIFMRKSHAQRMKKARRF